VCVREREREREIGFNTIWGEKINYAEQQIFIFCQ